MARGVSLTYHYVACLPVPVSLQTSITNSPLPRYEDQDLLQNRPPLQQALVISAGVIANVLLSFSLLFGTVATAGLPRPQFAEGPYVMKLVERDCPAAQAGIQPEDLILAVRQACVCVCVDGESFRAYPHLVP